MSTENIQASKSKTLVLVEQIQEHAPISKKELQENTGFSWGTISTMTNALAEAGYIVAKGKVTNDVGRKPDEYDINPEKNYFVGIDFSSSGMLIVVTDMKGRIIEQQESQWKQHDRTAVSKQLFATLDVIMERYADCNVKGIGVAAQGIVNISEGICVDIGGIAGWKDVPLKAMLEERYETAVVIFHDPDCRMKCECTFGVLKESDKAVVALIYFVQGRGIGMSVMINGNIYSGVHGKAGEIGRVIVGTRENGEYDFLEYHLSRQELEWNYRVLTGDVEKISYEVILERAKAGDAACIEVLHSVYRYIGQGAAVVSNLFNPEMIVLHTVDCFDEELLIQIVEEDLRKGSYDKTVQLKVSDLNKEATAVGASLMVIEKVINDIF